MWINYSLVIKSEVKSEKEKPISLMHIYGIQKNGSDEPIFQGKNRDADEENGLMNKAGEEEEGQTE